MNLRFILPLPLVKLIRVELYELISETGAEPVSVQNSDLLHRNCNQPDKHLQQNMKRKYIVSFRDFYEHYITLDGVSNTHGRFIPPRPPNIATVVIVIMAPRDSDSLRGCPLPPLGMAGRDCFSGRC